MGMKKILMTVAIAVFAVAAQAALPLAEARASIDKAIAEPATMQKLVSQLSAADQVKFLGDVNAAIAKMPGSDADRTAAFVAANRAAYRAAAKGNLAKLVAETYATVSIISLTVINEQLAKNVFNRAADKSVTYTDAEFIKIAEKTMEVVNERLEAADETDLRAGYAALMFIRASNSESDAIKDAMIATLPESAREKARNEWYPAALAEGSAKTYDPMLPFSELDKAGTVDDMAISLTGIQMMDALLSDLNAGNFGGENSLSAPITDAAYIRTKHDFPKATDEFENAALNVPEKPYEPGLYQWQTTGGN